MERSCTQCHQRKVRCSKTLPCTACVRLGASCRYPTTDANVHRPRRVQKVTITDRIAQLERSLAVLTNSAGPLQGSDNPNARVTSAPLLPEPAQSPNRPQELLVPDGASTRYINETFLSQILDKERALYKVIGTPRDTDEITSGLRPEGLLASSRYPANSSNVLDLSRWQSAQLWQIYRNNVDPVVKILHLPTVEPLVYSTMNGEGSDDCRALLFAIYFAAVTSLSEVDAANLLGRNRRCCLLDFQARIEKVLIDAACLDAPSMLSLQALAIYIVRFAFPITARPC